MVKINSNHILYTPLTVDELNAVDELYPHFAALQIMARPQQGISIAPSYLPMIAELIAL